MPDTCSCSNSRYTGHILTSAFPHLDISKDFIEKNGVIIHYTVYNLLLRVGYNINAS
jgi:hypothetical protein